MAEQIGILVREMRGLAGPGHWKNWAMPRRLTRQPSRATRFGARLRLAFSAPAATDRTAKARRKVVQLLMTPFSRW